MYEEFLNNLPKSFKQNVLAMPHFNGEKWLKDLPVIIQRIEKKWSLKVANHYPNLSYNFVAPCVLSDNREAVIKIGMPEEDSEIFDEARVLEFYKGRGAVELLRVEMELEVLLLEKIKPGKSLNQVFEKEKNKTIDKGIELLGKLLIKPPDDTEFPKLEKWFSSFNRKRKSLPLIQFSKAAGYFEKLNTKTEHHFLLHADFHHENILSSEREDFLAIDPKGMIGNPGYDIAVFLNNHAIWIRSEKNFENHLNMAVEKFSEAFSIPEKIIKQWAYAQQVLSAWWYYEDGLKNWQKHLQFAEIWEKI